MANENKHNGGLLQGVGLPADAVVASIAPGEYTDGNKSSTSSSDCKLHGQVTQNDAGSAVMWENSRMAIHMDMAPIIGQTVRFMLENKRMAIDMDKAPTTLQTVGILWVNLMMAIDMDMAPTIMEKVWFMLESGRITIDMGMAPTMRET